jgi:hypothetical protein
VHADEHLVGSLLTGSPDSAIGLSVLVTLLAVLLGLASAASP